MKQISQEARRLGSYKAGKQIGQEAGMLSSLPASWHSSGIPASLIRIT